LSQPAPYTPRLTDFPDLFERVRLELVSIRTNLDDDEAESSTEVITEHLVQLAEVQITLVKRIEQLTERLIRDKEKNGPRPR
jgi:hypothetical protein